MLPERNHDALLALLAVGRHRSRFVGKQPLADLLVRLKPVEEAFFDLAEAVDEDHDVDDSQDSAAPFDPSFIDPAVLNPAQ